MKLKNSKFNLFTGKEFWFFSLFLFFTITKSQTFERFSDQKKFDSLIIIQNQKQYIVTKENFRSFSFKNDDKILYKNNTIDFAINNDTLVFFDKVKEIESVALSSTNNINYKSEKEISITKLKNNFFCLQTNYPTGLLVKIDTGNKKNYIKSITLFPKIISTLKDEATIEISLLPIINNLPDGNNPILTFTESYSNIKKNKWTILLPRIIKYPEDGFILSFNLKYKDKVDALYFQSSQDTSTFQYNPQYYGGWAMTHPIGFMYKLKILQ